MIKLAVKMSNLGLLKFELAIGALIMAAAVIGLPASILFTDASLLLNPYLAAVLAAAILILCSLGYFAFVRPYFLYRKLPAVQAESDGEFLYIHSKKEAKIPLAELSEAFVYTDYPFMFRENMLHEFIIHIFSEEYGNIVLEIPGYGKYKLYFVSHVRDASDGLIRYLGLTMGEDDQSYIPRV